MLSIRAETPADHAAIRHVNERAFKRAAEADLVDVLRRAAVPHLSLVAEAAGRVVGHVFFSAVTVDSRGGSAVMGLAPMAVLPEHQRQGIGSALVRAGLRACADIGSEAVVVLGHPEYYGRFGFKPAAAFGLGSAYDVPVGVFMALELKSGSLEGESGTVEYHAAFREMA